MDVKCPRCDTDNPPDSKFCRECATPLPPSGKTVPSVTRTLETPREELHSGAVFAGRYRIIEELGKGGMGKVYRALDEKLNEEVALKLIKPEIASDKRTLERFKNELKLARKVVQKNVARMFDLGEETGLHYITMEYIPGEDLKSFIRRVGQMPVGKSLAIANQVCAGLAEAHGLGIVHRDLKPSNIMIDKEGDARIMDFGIARSLSARGITAAGMMIGTPEYMSPEQVEGKDADGRSDIYSLGIILYEMLTGRVPFEGDTPFTIGVKHKSEAPKDPRGLNAQIPQDLSRLILKCLEKNKESRYQSADGLRTELEKIEKGIPISDRATSKRKAITSKEITVTFSAKKLIIPGLVFIALIAAGIILWRVLPSKKTVMPPSPAGKPVLAVLNFENKTRDEKLDGWRTGLPGLLIHSISQSKYIRVIEVDEMLTILRRLGLDEAREYSSEDIAKIAAQARATHILKGSFYKAGELFRITAGLQKTGTGDASSPLNVEARGEEDIIRKADELTRQVKEGLGLTALQMASDIKAEAGSITTSSPEALQYYIEGRRHHIRIEYDKAVGYMEKAVALDPEFSLAYRSLGIEYYQLERRAEGRNSLKKAVDTSSRLPENERLPIAAVALIYDEKYDRAIEALEKLLNTYPDHKLGLGLLANIYRDIGDFDKAIKLGEAAVNLQRTSIGVGNLADYYMAKGLYQKAEDACQSFLRDIDDKDFYIHVQMMRNYMYRRQFDRALAEAEKLYLLDPGRGSRYKGRVLFFKDDLAPAEEILGRGEVVLTLGKFEENISLIRRDLDKAKGDKESEANAQRRLSEALEKAGRHAEALQALERAMKLSTELWDAAADSGIPYLPSRQKQDLFAKGRIQAEMRAYDEAEQTAAKLRVLIDQGLNKKELRRPEFILGLIELGKKNYQKASELFGMACSRLDFEFRLGADHALFFDGQARALYEAGDLDKARLSYEKITMLTTGKIGHGDIYARAFYWLGRIAERQRNKARAREHYGKFLDLWKNADPGLPEVEDARKRLASL